MTRLASALLFCSTLLASPVLAQRMRPGEAQWSEAEHKLRASYAGHRNVMTVTRQDAYPMGTAFAVHFTDGDALVVVRATGVYDTRGAATVATILRSDHFPERGTWSAPALMTLLVGLGGPMPPLRGPPVVDRAARLMWPRLLRTRAGVRLVFYGFRPGQPPAA